VGSRRRVDSEAAPRGRGALAWASAIASALALAMPHEGLAQTAEVAILDYKYQPPELKIKAGTTVRWVNKEKRTSHSVIWLGPTGGFESERLFPGDAYERGFDKPGAYPYACGPHPEMKGVVVVTE